MVVGSSRRGRSRGRGGGMGVFRPIRPSCEISQYDDHVQLESDLNQEQVERSLIVEQHHTIERPFQENNNLDDGVNEHMDEELAVIGTEIRSSDVSVPSKKRKGRGKAIGISKPSSLDKRMKVKFEVDRPVGPERSPFITKIGIWANDQKIFPYQTKHFDHFPEDKFVKVFKDAIEYFDIQYDGNVYELVKAMCRSSWNDRRSKLFRNKYLKYKTYEDALRHPPVGIDKEVWAQICDVFNDPKWKEMSLRNKSNRAHQDVLHISGRTSFAQRKVILREKNDREPFRFEIIESCYLRGDDSSTNPATKTLTDLVHQAKSLPIDPVSGAPQGEDQIFEEFLGPECKRRKRVMARVATESDYISLRDKLDELILQLAERDKRDAERDKRDAEREIRELENERLIQRLIAQVESLSEHQNGASVSQLPQQFHGQTISHIPQHQNGASFSQIPRQFHGKTISHMPQQLHLPYSQHNQVPYTRSLWSNQNTSSNQLNTPMTYRQPQMPLTRVGFTDLLRSGINNNTELLSEHSLEKEHEVARTGMDEDNGQNEWEE